MPEALRTRSSSRRNRGSIEPPRCSWASSTVIGARAKAPPAAAPFVLYKRPAFEDPDNAQLTFTLDLMAKDLDLILSLAREVGAPMEQAQRNRELVERAISGGFSGRDLSAVAEYFRRSG